MLIADAHKRFRSMVKETLSDHTDFEIVGETGSAVEALGIARRVRPEIAVVAVGGSALDGFELTRRLAGSVPETAVIVISIHADERYAQRARRFGARAYVLKDKIFDDLVDVIRAARQGTWRTTVSED